MSSRSMQYFTLVGLFLVLIAAGCGPKPIQKESVLDTPENHYNQGLRALNQNQIPAAAEEFKRATALNPDYPGGYVGLGLALSHEKKYEDALKLVDKGLDKDSKFIDGYIAKGQIYTHWARGKDWLDDAVKQFDKALKLNSKSEKALFYKGVAYKNAYRFGDAAAQFSKVIELKGDLSQDANDEWELVQKIQRAAPGTKIGKKIALIPKIDRADLAVLFVEELKLLELLEKKRPKEYDTGFRPPDDPTAMKAAEKANAPVASDIAGHWAKNWITDVVKVGAMGIFPDNTFRPDEKITRANYAVFLQDILIVATGDESLATKYIGTASRFPDVNPTHFAYNAICLTVDRGIMKANTMDGAFGMSEPVSGADALLIIRELQNALRMTF